MYNSIHIHYQIYNKIINESGEAIIFHPIPLNFSLQQIPRHRPEPTIFRRRFALTRDGAYSLLSYGSRDRADALKPQHNLRRAIQGRP